MEYVFNRAECLSGYARVSNDLELFGRVSIDTKQLEVVRIARIVGKAFCAIKYVFHCRASYLHAW